MSTNEGVSERECFYAGSVGTWEPSTIFVFLVVLWFTMKYIRQEFSSILEYWIVVHDLPKGISWHSYSSNTIAITGIGINNTASTKFKLAWKVKSCENAYKSCITILCLLLLFVHPPAPAHIHTLYVPACQLV